MLRRLRRLVVVGAALILGAGCRTVSNADGSHGLPPAPPDTTDFSDYEPDHPFEPTKPGVAERSVFTAPSDEGHTVEYTVEVRDFLVAPAQPEADLAITLADAAVLEVRQGSGEATVGKEKIELRPGTVFTVDAGEPLWLTTRDEPLALRAWIVSPGGEQ
jgi:mannose-6-phosphate isomerase-like protein (cupin superfamily)